MQNDKPTQCPSRACETGYIQKNNSGWFLAFGLLMMVLGIAAVSSAFYATIFSVFLFGLLLIGMGVAQLVQATLAHRWRGFFVSLLLGILYAVTGAMLVVKPATAAVTITFWIAAFCFVAGLFRMLSSLIMRFEKWGWVFFNGLVTFILGILIFSDWPVSGLWIIGLFIGIDMILSGWSWVLLSISPKNQER